MCQKPRWQRRVYRVQTLTHAHKINERSVFALNDVRERRRGDHNSQRFKTGRRQSHNVDVRMRAASCGESHRWTNQQQTHKHIIELVPHRQTDEHAYSAQAVSSLFCRAKLHVPRLSTTNERQTRNCNR